MCGASLALAPALLANIGIVTFAQSEYLGEGERH
jgi:hypothetical protein